MKKFTSERRFNVLQQKPETTHNNSVYRIKLVTPSMSEKRLLATFNYAFLEQGMKLDPHQHVDGVEYYFFLRGVGRMMIDGKWFDVSPNDFVEIPIGLEHSLINRNREKLEFLTLRTMLDLEK